MLPVQRPYGYVQPQITGPMGPNNMPYGSPQDQPEVFIELTKEQRPIIKNLVNPKEKIFYAGTVNKVNKYLTVQKRILVITDKTLYNIEPDDGLFSFSMCSNTGGYTIKRKIPMAKIFGVTLSVNPASQEEQFIIHVNRDYDYCYNGGLKRERIIKSLWNAHFRITQEPFLIYCREEASLKPFHTTDDDLAIKKNRRPKEGKIYVTAEMVPNGLGWIIFHRKELAYKSSLLPNGPIPNPIQPMPYNQNQYDYRGPFNGAPNNFPGPVYGAPTNPPGPYNGPTGPVIPTGKQGHESPYDYRQPVNQNAQPVYYIPNAQPQQPSPTFQQNNGVNQPNTQNQGYGAQTYNNVRPSTPQNQPQPYGQQFQAQSPNNFGGYPTHDTNVLRREFTPTAPNHNVQLNFDTTSPSNRQNTGLNQNRGNVGAQYPTFGGQGNFAPQYPSPNYGGQGNMRPNY